MGTVTTDSREFDRAIRRMETAGLSGDDARRAAAHAGQSQCQANL